MKYTPYKCSCCGRHLALTNGVRLLFGEAFTDEPCPLKCAGCGKRSYWRPVQKVDIGETRAYTELVPV